MEATVQTSTAGCVAPLPSTRRAAATRTTTHIRLSPRPPPVAAGLRRLFAGWAADPLTLSASRTTLAPAEAPRGRADEDVRADG